MLPTSRKADAGSRPKPRLAPGQRIHWQGKAAVSWIGAHAWRSGFVYVFTADVCVSVTVMLTPTLVPAEAKTQWRLLSVHPLTTLITTSGLLAEKNQRSPPWLTPRVDSPIGCAIPL